MGIVAIVLFLLSCGYNSIRYEMTDTAYLGGDVWYYQSIAVNLVSGDGYRFGPLHDFADYKFTPVTDPHEQENYHQVKELFLGIDRFDFYGSPGFALFVAGIYSVVGVHPITVKFINLFLVAMAATLLPFISVRVWPRHGFTTGVMVSAYFIFALAPDPSTLLGESLVMFLLASWGLLLTYSETRLSVTRIVMLGVWTAVLILVKSYVLLVIMTTAFIVLKHPSRRTGMAMAALYVTIIAGLILPWSIYATRHSDRVVVISTQFDNLIMDGNNEDSISGGGWSPWWRKENKEDPRYLYNRLADSDMSTLEKVGRFYRENWTKLPELFANKIYSATGRKVSVILILLVFIAYHVVGLRRNRRLRRAGRPGDIHMPAFPLFCFAVWISSALIAFGLLRYTLIFLPFMLITAAYAPLEFRRLRQERRDSLVADE